MVVKIYISGISGNKEVKKRQQRVLLILDSRGIKYEVIDIAEPDNEAKKDFMQTNSTSSGGTIGDPNPRHPLPPQLFNEDAYCGDYDQFDMANEIDEMEKFLKLAPDDSAPTVTSNAEIKLGNGEIPKQEETETKEPKADENETKENSDNKPETNDNKEDAKVEPEGDAVPKAENGAEEKAEEKEEAKEAADE